MIISQEQSRSKEKFPFDKARRLLNDEPVHIHVCKGVPTPNATKIWIPPTGNPIIAHNHGNIPTKDLNRLRKGVAANKESIVCSRRHFFSLVSYPEAKEIPPIFRYIQ